MNDASLNGAAMPGGLPYFQALKRCGIERRAQFMQGTRCSTGKVRPYGRKYVAAMKGSTDGLPVIRRIRKQDGGMYRLFRKHIAKKSVVGTHEEPFTGVKCDGPARTADARVYHADKHSIGGEVAVGGSENPRAGGNPLRRDLVGDINDVRAGRDTGNDSFHDADIAVANAKVGQ